MGMRCSRVGCGGYAVASFCFDGRAALVWLDPLDPDRGTGAGVLCARHADTLTPPRGWHLQDRRTPTPRLWDDRPPFVLAAAPASAHTTPPRSLHPPTDPLPFEEVAVAEPIVRSGTEPIVRSGTEPVETLPSNDVDDLLDARTPLLARAFAAAGWDRAVD